ncbi:hypothetical protein ACFL4O_02310 [bacterium]
MVTIKIFGKQDCDACKSTKGKFDLFLSRWGKTDTVEVIFFDMDTVEGLTEAAMLDAVDVPTTIIEKQGKEVARWEKKVPMSNDFKQYFE